MEKLGLLASCCAVLALGDMANSAVWAQTDTGTLEVVTVTAEKRTENQQDVPIAVTSISAQTLDRNSINTTQDLSVAVPSLNYNNFAGFGQPYLRGIGTDITQPNVDPGVATYVDGVFVANTYAIIMDLLGVERMEVLEGPQGTLYGRNAVGGAINIYTLTPGQDIQSKVTLDLGDYARKELSGYISGPITDTLSAGIYFGGILRNSYLSGVETTIPTGRNEEPSRESTWGVRGKFVWEPTSKFTLTGSIESDALITRENALRQIDPDAVGYIYYDAPKDIKPYLITNDFADFLRTRSDSATLNENLDLGWADLVGITGYRNFKADGSTDFDGTTAEIFSFQSESGSRQFSQEVQLLSPDGSAIKWIGGLYFYTEDGGYFPVTEDYGGASLNITTRYMDYSYAGFGQATAPLSFIADNLNLTIGLRYSVEQKNWHAFQTVNVFEPDGHVGPQIVPTEFFGPIQKKWNDLSPKFTLDYKWDDTLFYATYSQGFKSGVFNLAAPTNVGPVNPEQLTDYEVGSKSTLWGGRVYLNTSAYYYDYKNIQVEVIVPPAGATAVQNAASATAGGVEGSLEAALTDDFTATTGVAYEQGHYGKFPNYAAATGAVDATGNPLERMPNWVYTLRGSYQHTLWTGGQLHADASLYWNGGFYWDPSKTIRQSAYEVVNASVGYAFQGTNIDASIWVTNLFNQYYSSAENANSLGILSADAPPRMFGVKLSWSLN